MKRVFIVILLGIISVCTISSRLSGYTKVHVIDKVLLDTVRGDVGAGEFRYWTLGHVGPILLQLISTAGDADLYVSDGPKPGYEVEEYNMSSASCGLEEVRVPANFPRPFGVSVFGHWSHAESNYTMLVYLDGEAMLTEAGALHGGGDTESIVRKKIAHQMKSHTPVQEDNNSYFLNLLYLLLDAVFEIFFFYSGAS